MYFSCLNFFGLDCVYILRMVGWYQPFYFNFLFSDRQTFRVCSTTDRAVQFGNSVLQIKSSMEAGDKFRVEVTVLVSSEVNRDAVEISRPHEQLMVKTEAESCMNADEKFQDTLVKIELVGLDVTSTVLLKFADNTKVARVVESEEQREELQSAINKLVEWSEKWQMTFNAGKCHMSI